MNENLRMILVLFCVCIVSAVSLSFLYTYTKPKIEKNQIAKELKTKSEILPQGKDFKEVEVENFGKLEECYDKEKNLVGILLKSSCKGYGGEIEYILCITTETIPKVINLKILSHKETPGLGANVQKDKFLNQFKFKDAKEIFLSKDSINGKIDAISGATITSRAITNSIRQLIEKEELKEYLKNKEKKEVHQQKENINVKKQQRISKPQTEQLEQQKILISTQTLQ